MQSIDDDDEKEEKRKRRGRKRRRRRRRRRRRWWKRRRTESYARDFLSTTKRIYKGLFLSITSSNKVNTGQLRSITVN